MGACGLGPFDNDTACDWGYALDEATLGERSAVLRKALTAAADETGYLDHTEAAEAAAVSRGPASAVAAGAPFRSTRCEPYAHLCTARPQLLCPHWSSTPWVPSKMLASTANTVSRFRPRVSVVIAPFTG